MAKNRPDLALYVTTRLEGISGERYFHVDVQVVKLHDGSIRNLHQTGEDMPLADLMIVSQGGGITDHPKLYGFEVEYRNVFGIDAPRAKAMHQVLSRLQKKLSQAYETRGTVIDFADYVGRVAEALGIQTVVERTGDTTGKWGANYADMTFRFMSVGQGVYHIRQIEQGWISRQQEVA